MDVEEHDVDSHEAEEYPRVVQHEGAIPQRAEIDKIAPLRPSLWGVALPGPCEVDGGRGECDEGHDAGGPAESNDGLCLPEDDGVDDAADAAADGGNPVGDAALGCEVGRHDGNTGQEEATIAEPDGHTLGEEDLIVFGADACHHHAENIQKRAQVQQ